MNSRFWDEITAVITAATGRNFAILSRDTVGGGCINQAQALRGEQRTYFLKLNSADALPMFEAEYAGLVEIRQSNSIRAPEPIVVGTIGNRAYLVMEYIEFGTGDRSSNQQLGEQLAAMHHHTSSVYGWSRDNTIGSTPQPNRQCGNWMRFWRDQRLAFQLRLAADKGYHEPLQSHGERLIAKMESILGTHQPAAALLHGDLWSGNFAFDHRSQPLLFDPAVYYGDRETDLAMTELFGGFSSRFYQAYQASYPLPDEYQIRKTLYNLYHVLNHLNLFGGGYQAQAQRMIERLLAEVG